MTSSVVNPLLSVLTNLHEEGIIGPNAIWWIREDPTMLDLRREMQDFFTRNRNDIVQVDQAILECPAYVGKDMDRLAQQLRDGTVSLGFTGIASAARALLEQESDGIEAKFDLFNALKNEFYTLRSRLSPYLWEKPAAASVSHKAKKENAPSCWFCCYVHN